MVRIIDWIKSWRRTQKITNALDSKIARVLKLKAKSDQDLAKAMRRLDHYESKAEAEAVTIKQLINNRDVIEAELGETLRAARSQLETCEQIVIPGLVSALKTYDSAWDYQTSRNALMHAATNQEREE